MGVRDRIGTVAERLKSRIGRTFGNCQSCGNPTQSHQLPVGKVCHKCYTGDCSVPLTDGGEVDMKEQPAITTKPDQMPREQRESDRWALFSYIDEGDYWGKRVVAPWDTGHGYPAKGWKESLTTFDEARKYTTLNGYEIETHIGIPDEALAQFGLFYHLDPEPSDDGIIFIDLDDVRDPETGALHKTAIELLESAGSYAQVSVSGTGIHIFLEGKLPDNVSTIQQELEENAAFPKAEIEVYDKDRLVAMTGDHVEDTPETVESNSNLVDEIVEEFHTEEEESVHDVEKPQKPAISRDEIRDVETTTHYKDVFDAVKLTDPSDIRLDSPVTEERSDAISRDPTWADSTSGTRLAELEDGWVYRAGMVGLDALQVVALEEGIIHDVSDYPSGEDFWDAVDELRRRGAHIPELDRTKLTLSTAAILPDTYYEDSQAGDTTAELREKVSDTIRGAITSNSNALIDAIMSGGKTYGSFKVAHELDEPISYFAPRLDMYDQAAEYCEEIGFDEDEIKVLPSMKRDCPTWDGQHGDDWREKVKRQYYSGARPKDIHTHNDDIPCRGDEDDDQRCPYEEMWDFDPDDYQVIIGHYKHSHVTHVTIGRTCVFDEDPAQAFTTTISGSKLAQSINTFLDQPSSPPVGDFDELLQKRDDRRTVAKCTRWFNQMVQADEFDFGEPDSRGVVERDGEGYHGYAPHAVYAILNSNPVAEGSNFERGFMPGEMGGTLFFTTSDEHGEYYVQLRESPELEYASSVLALDGTPLIDESRPNGQKAREWVQSLGVQLPHKRVLTDSERAAYIRDTLGHRYVQVSEAANPYSSGRYNNMTEDAALCAAVGEVYGGGEAPVVFTPKSVADQYRDAGWEDKGLAKEIDHPGNLRGTNKYAEERVAVQLGSSHHGDHEIRRRAAWLHTDVEVTGKGMERDYGSELGNSILRQMRENQTAQNVMRVGRDGEGATVVLKTAAFPDYFPIDGTGAVTGWPDGMKQVLTAWADLSLDELKTVEVAEITSHRAVDVSARQVRNSLDRFVELGYVKKMDHPEDGRKNVYVDDGLSDVDPEERAELELPDVEWPAEDGISADEEIRLTSVYTSNFRSSPGSRSGGGGGSQHDVTPDGQSRHSVTVGDPDGGGNAPE